MAKIEIIGPNELLMAVLALLRELGVFQIEQDITCFIGEEEEEEQIRSALLDEKALAERIFYEDLRGRIDELFSCLPKAEIRASYLDPGSLLDSIIATVQRHGVTCREWCRKKESLQKELAELSGYAVILGAVEPSSAR
jgi:V/A-type H+-transporting ATPase subunit I